MPKASPPDADDPPPREGKLWDREEHIIAFNLYSQIPFGTIHMGNPKVMDLADILGRSAGSVSYKLSNFARLDPALRARGIRGSPHGAKGEEEVWREFAERPEALVYESTRLLADRIGKSIEDTAEIDESDLPPPGRDREAIVRLRANQSFFRKRVLSAYQFRCCVTGLSRPELLVASHILPWAENPAHRLNPKNGLCLNALHDRAFDRHLMWVDAGYIVHFTPDLHGSVGRDDSTLEWLLGFEGAMLRLSETFVPDVDFLGQHASRCRAGP